MIDIKSNGSKWYGEEPDQVETLLEKLKTYTLDPTFENYGNFITLDAKNFKGELLNPLGTVSFFGNFFDISSVFSIDTDEPELIEKLTKAIRLNQSTEAYKIAKIECERHEAERKKRRGY